MLLSVASEEGVSKLAGMRSNSTSGRRSHIGRDSDLLNMLVQDAESNLGRSHMWTNTLIAWHCNPLQFRHVVLCTPYDGRRRVCG